MNRATNTTGANHVDTNKQLAESTLSSINEASTAGRALYTGFLALTAYIIVALGTTDDLQFFDRAPLTPPLLNVEISLTGFYRYMPWLYVIVHANLLLLFSMIAEKHRYFAALVDNCAWPDRVHMRQQLHVNAFTQFLGADHKGLLALILKVMIWFTVGLIPPLLLLAIQLDFLAAQIESVTSWQQTAVLIDCLLAGYFWNNILQKERRARFPKDWSPPFWKRYLLEGWVLWVSVVFIIGFSGLVALVPLSDYERSVHNRMPEWEWLGLAKSDCVFSEELEKLRALGRAETISTDENEKLIKLENVFNTQLVDASKEAREWTAPYRCSNRLTWWFIDRSDSWLNERLEIRRWLNLPDKVFVENRKTVQPQWLNRLTSDLGNNTDDDKANKPSPDENTGKTTNADSTANFKTLDYFLPVNKENQHFHFARFSRSFLPNAKMKRAQLQGANLTWAQLQGADLEEAQLQGAFLVKAQLQDASLSNAQLQGAFLYGAQLQGANLSYAQLQDANLLEAQLQGASLHSAQLQGKSLSNAQLQGADLSDAQLQGASLHSAQLRGASLIEAQLQGADLSDAQLQGASLHSAQLLGASLSYAQLQSADLSQAQLQGADLSYAQLQSADLSQAQLQGADLSYAQLQGADLSYAQLQGANLSYAQLQGADLYKVRLAGVQFSEVKLDHVLILDPSVDWEEQDDDQMSILKTNSSLAVNERSKERLLAATKRMENAKNNPLPEMSEAILEIQDHRCLLLTDNKELLTSAQGVCDSASDPSINPLKHLRSWAKYNVQMSCKHKRFSKFTEHYSGYDNLYKIVKDYRTDSNDTTLQQASEALTELVYFFYYKELIQIHQNKPIPCEARPELDAWYQEAEFENDPELKTRILELELEPFPTSAED